MLEKGQPVQFSLVPTGQSKENFSLAVLAADEKEQVLKEIENCCAVIKDEKKLKAAWEVLIEKRTPQYLYNFSAVPAMPGRYIPKVLKKLGFVNKLLPQKYLTGIVNYISCEAHLDVATEVLRKKLFKK